MEKTQHRLPLRGEDELLISAFFLLSQTLYEKRTMHSSKTRSLPILGPAVRWPGFYLHKMIPGFSSVNAF